MSWESKTEYCGLAVEDKILVKSCTLGKTGQYLEKLGRTGAYAATKAYGERSTPGNSYTIADDVTVSGVALGTVTEVEGKSYALAGVTWSTGADQEPTLEGSSAQVEDGAETRNTFPVPEFKLSPDQVAQIPEFKFTGENSFTPAFSLPTTVPASGSTAQNADCELTACGCEISCKVGTNDKNGYPYAHDVTTGRIVINITIGQYGAVVPTVTPAAGWKMSSPLTCDDPDSDMPTWTCSLSRPLAKTMAANPGSAQS